MDRKKMYRNHRQTTGHKNGGEREMGSLRYSGDCIEGYTRMHELMSYRRFGRARSLRSGRAHARARSLRSDRAE
ncbi:hypothetical protein F2Q70_00030904 [Brassica cretica]|uniref:Uncharacterized protein n=1 Tax=Brassica cretica TaxID=69181 RepID=A0A8S9FCA5_BRACR|nr:hypothetical protein F2Q70_00030904 [Brassica cretica]